MISMIEALEWSAFGGSLCSLYLYGKKGIKGPIAGIATAVAFLGYGFTANVPAAVISNCVFMALHIKNLRSAIMNDAATTNKKIIKATQFLMAEMLKTATDAGWWKDKDTGEPIDPETVFHKHICMMHEELSEVVTAHKTDSMDKHLPHRHGMEVELADLIIRALQYGAAAGWDIPGAIAEKNQHNKTRPDHKIENRGAPGSKRY